MSIVHRLLRKPFFGRFEAPWKWPSEAEETKWERVAFRNLRPEREAPKVLGRPSVLLIYGDQDKYTPPAYGERLMRAFGRAARTEICVIPFLTTSMLLAAHEARARLC